MKTLSFFTLFFTLLSCTKELDLDIPALPQKVVVNSLFCPDSVMKIHVSLTAGIKEEKTQIVENATVKLYEDEILIKTITTQNNGFYNSFYHPQVGKNYKIEVAVPDFETVWAESKMPHLPTSVTGIYKIIPQQVDEFGVYKTYTILTFTDDANTKNYYEVGSNSFRFEQTEETDESILSDSELDFNPRTYFFSDDLFNGQQKKLFKQRGGRAEIDPWGNFFAEEFFLHDFKSVSEEYYNFRKSWTKHVFNQNTTAHYDDPTTLLFLGDPIEMYTNIQGGYGIFAGYNQQIIEVKYVE